MSGLLLTFCALAVDAPRHLGGRAVEVVLYFVTCPTVTRYALAVDAPRLYGGRACGVDVGRCSQKSLKLLPELVHGLLTWCNGRMDRRRMSLHDYPKICQ
jgi:hypothetical protein